MTGEPHTSRSGALVRRRSRRPEFRRSPLGYQRGQVDGLVDQLIGSVDEFRDRARTAEENEREVRFELTEVSRVLHELQREPERAEDPRQERSTGAADGAELIEAVQLLANRHAADIPRRALEAAQAGWLEVLHTLDENADVHLTPEGAAVFSTIITAAAREATQATAESGAAVADLVRRWLGAPSIALEDPPPSSATQRAGRGSDVPARLDREEASTLPTSGGDPAAANDEGNEGSDVRLVRRLEAFDERIAVLGWQLDMVRAWSEHLESEAGPLLESAADQVIEPEQGDLEEAASEPDDSATVDVRERIRPFTAASIDLTDAGQSSTRLLQPVR